MTEELREEAAVGRARSSAVPRRYGWRGQVGEQAVADRMPLAMKEHTATNDRLDSRARPQMPLLVVEGGRYDISREIKSFNIIQFEFQSRFSEGIGICG